MDLVKIAPVLEELAGDYDGKADILKLDVDENPSTAAKYEVMSIPTLIVFKDGEPVDKVVVSNLKKLSRSIR